VGVPLRSGPAPATGPQLACLAGGPQTSGPWRCARAAPGSAATRSCGRRERSCQQPRHERGTGIPPTPIMSLGCWAAVRYARSAPGTAHAGRGPHDLVNDLGHQCLRVSIAGDAPQEHAEKLQAHGTFMDGRGPGWGLRRLCRWLSCGRDMCETCCSETGWKMAPSPPPHLARVACALIAREAGPGGVWRQSDGRHVQPHLPGTHAAPSAPAAGKPERGSWDRYELEHPHWLLLGRAYTAGAPRGLRGRYPGANAASPPGAPSPLLLRQQVRRLPYGCSMSLGSCGCVRGANEGGPMWRTREVRGVLPTPTTPSAHTQNATDTPLTTHSSTCQRLTALSSVRCSHGLV
jgi:hypothetical protein